MPPDADQTYLDVETEPGALKRRSVHGAAVSFIGQAIRVLLQFGSQLYLAHLISPSAFGLIAMVSPILRFTQLFNTMGLLEAVVQRTSISHRELSGLFWVNLAGSILLALAFLVTAPLAAWFYDEPRLPEVMVCLCVILLLGGLSAQPMALLSRQMRFLPLTLIDVLSTVCAALVGIGMASLGFDYWSLVGLQVANSLTLCAMAWIFCGWRPSRPRWEPGIMPLLGFGGHITGFSVLGFFAESFDKVLLGATVGTMALGLYDRSSTLVMSVLVLTMATLTRIAIPLLSRVVDAAERYRRTFIWTLQTALIMTTPGLLCVILVPECVILTLLGPKWVGAVPIIRLMAIGSVVHPIIGSTSWLFVSQNRADQQLVWGSLGFAAVVVSFLVGLPWGPVGVAGSWAVCSWLVWTPLILWAATRSGPVRMSNVLEACAPIAASAALACVFLWLVKLFWDIDTFGELVLALLLSYGAHGLVLASIPGGRRFLKEAWALRTTLRETSV